MKIDVFKNSDGTSCLPEGTSAHNIGFRHTIEADETDLPITENWAGDGIEVGEVFSCNEVIPNLIRTA